MLKRFWRWLDTPAAARWISGITAAYLFVATWGSTGNFWRALGGVMMFFAIWMIGRATVEQDDWQPIETAPTDGSEFLGYRQGRVANAARVPRDDCEMWSFGGTTAAVEFCPWIKPTHWRPKLKPPRNAGAQDHGK